MSYEYWVDTVLTTGFVAQLPSKFDDAFEGCSNLNCNMRLDASAFDSRYRILCFNKDYGTTESAAMLMWSLYAKHSSGVRLVLDVPDDVAWPSTVLGIDVEYEDAIRTLSIDDLSALLIEQSQIAASEAAAIRRLYGSKPKCWEWENEYRLVMKKVPNGDTVECALKKTLEDGRRNLFCTPFLKQYISGVDFGLRVDMDKVARDVDEVRQSRNLCYRFAKSYKVEKRIAYMPINPGMHF